MALYFIRPDSSTGSNTTIDSANPTLNYNTTAGIKDNLYVGEANTGVQTLRTLISFNFSQIPSSEVCISATLVLYQWALQSSNTRTLEVFRQKRNWNKDQATWNLYSTGNSWQTAGGFGANDCEQTSIGSLSMSSTEPSGLKYISLNTTSITEMWDGTWTNYGFLIKMQVESDDAQLFRSSNFSTESQRPYILINTDPKGSFFQVF